MKPLRTTLIVGSNRHGRFGPVVADWLLARARARADLTTEVIDTAAADLPTTFARSPQTDTALAGITPGWKRRTPSSSSPPSTTTPSRRP